MTPRGRMTIAPVGAVAVALALGVQPGLAATGKDLRQALRQWTSAHPDTTALVWRLDTAGPVPVAAYKPDVPRLPASTMKVVTAAGALLGMGPEFRFTTRLYAGAQATQAGGVLNGPVYLKGSGDPLLATPDFARTALGGLGGNLGRLARPLRDRGIRLVRGPLVADERLFDDLRQGPQWRASYAGECAPLSAMAVNLNSTAGAAPALSAARIFRTTMQTAGVRQVGPVRVGRAPARGRLLAEVDSPPMHAVVRAMNPSSNNFIAETLRKAVGAYGPARDGSTGGGGAETARLLRERGLLTTGDALVDGSGLSRANRLTATTLVKILAAAEAEPEWGTALIQSLPQGGTGTLRRRFLGPIAPRVRGKTGYINGVTSLAGVAESPRGIRYAYALVMNDQDIGGAQATQNRVVSLLARGAGDLAAPVDVAAAAPAPTA